MTSVSNIRYGYDANKPANPVQGDIWLAIDTFYLYVCFTTGSWESVAKLYLLLAGGTMTGAIAMGDNLVTGLPAPVSDGDAARKKYVDDGLALRLALAGGTMTGSIIAGLNQIINHQSDNAILRVLASSALDNGSRFDFYGGDHATQGGDARIVIGDKRSGYTLPSEFIIRYQADGSVASVFVVDKDGNITDVGTVDGKTVANLSQVKWKDASENALTDLNRTSTLAYTDLDLTAFTSAAAKFAILRLGISVDSISAGGSAYLAVRKNGTAPSAPPILWIGAAAGDAAGAYHYITTLVGLNTGQVIEYQISVGGTIQIDSYIDVLGYIE